MHRIVDWQGLMYSFKLVWWALFVIFLLAYYFSVGFVEIDSGGTLADQDPDLFNGFNNIFVMTFDRKSCQYLRA